MGLSKEGSGMKLSRTVAYALQATMQLAADESNAPVPCSRLAAKGDMPERFLLQVLRSLVNHGVLRSTRGVDGGYKLIRPPEDISLLDVIEAIEGPVDTKLPLSGETPDALQRNLQEALQHVSNAAREQLQAIKIAQLIRPPGGGLASEHTEQSARSAVDSVPPPSDMLM